MEPCWDAGDARNSLEKQLVHGINGDGSSTQRLGGLIPKKKAHPGSRNVAVLPLSLSRRNLWDSRGVLPLEKGKRRKIEGKAEPREKELNQLRMERVLLFFFPQN